MTATLLLTGFEPFGGELVNPSWEIARALDGWVCEGRTVRAVRLPCAFGDALRTLDDALAAHRPELVICLGQAGGRAEISIERVALNVDDARIPDNLGRQPIDTAVVPEGPPAYFSTLPIKALARDLRAAGVAAAVSNTAGTFVCNHVFYALMHRLATAPALAHARGGFVHVPYTPEQVAARPGVAAMALATQVGAIRQALRSAVLTRADVRETAGREH
jgi:pyroglutamyl-peptidase